MLEVFSEQFVYDVSNSKISWCMQLLLQHKEALGRQRKSALNLFSYNQAKLLEEMDAEFGVGDLVDEEFGAGKEKVGIQTQKKKNVKNT